MNTPLIVGSVLNTQSLSCALGFALSLDPSANTGNDLKNLLHFSPGEAFFCIYWIGVRCGNICSSACLRQKLILYDTRR